MFNYKTTRAFTKIEYIKTGSQYQVYADTNKTAVYAPVNNEPKWVNGFILESSEKVLAVPATNFDENQYPQLGKTVEFENQQYMCMNDFGRCLIKETKNPHNKSGMIYVGVDKNDGKEKLFARVAGDISGFKEI